MGANGCLKCTLDLGLTYREVCIEGSVLKADKLEINLDYVVPKEEDRVVILDEQGFAYEVIKRTNAGIYKLKAVALNKAPTIEVSGIHMHRIVGTDPWSDALAKVNAARVFRGCTVLDTCTGLGYTAIASTLKGAREVYTFEVDEGVTWVASRNPWSHKLSSKAIKTFRGNVVELVKALPNNYFHRVIHDPPRFTKSTGDLYSSDFYRELFRVTRPRGIIFHYTGEPLKHSNISLIKGIKERLDEAGFRVTYFSERALGYIAVKPG